MKNQRAAALLRKIEDRKAVVGVIGLGYVGLPLAIEFARAGFPVVGFDLDRTKVAKINRGAS
ncbi:MAG TPA: NAD(P)-binding domain-containing protein, partial [bacterium]|nr:NAD(P)-binding domain-containing protein [bacterium]